MGKKNSSIKLFLSNRLENLAEALIENIERDRLSPMQPEVILVQSRGMARWLNLQRARRCGIQLNSQYVFPRVLIDRLIDGVLPDYKTAEKSAFNRDSLKWFIFENLPSMGKLEGAEPIRHYLEKSETSSSLLRRYLLAEKMAYLFDQHQVYRPDLLGQWESSPTPE
ncbi:MAG: exodeoxyribonuclease V subunit gamma, partial [Opitutae bacterium]|nr:exodeoxyribonuclease V subunit gamma [Opitutae bacterium]